MTSYSVLQEVGHILERLPQRVTSLYGTALTLPIVKWCHFRRDISFCGMSCNCIKFHRASLLHHATSRARYLAEMCVLCVNYF